MSGRYLLDTNIVIGLLENEPGIASFIASLDRVFLSPIVVGELAFGAENSARPEENLARVSAFTDRFASLRVDRETAKHYGKIKSFLKRKGRPIPENDLWIAASALQHELVLVSRDQHFLSVEGLLLEAVPSA